MKPRNDGKSIRQEEAVQRQEAYNKLSNEEKIALLDKRLGKDVGAKKQRNRLTTHKVCDTVLETIEKEDALIK